MTAMHRVRRVMTATFVAVIGCGKDSSPTEPKANEEVRVSLSVPSVVNQTVDGFPYVTFAITANAYSTLGKPVTVSCTVDGEQALCGSSVEVLPGAHTSCAIGRSETGMVSESVCRETVVNRLEATGRVLAVGETGGMSYPAGLTIYFGPDGPERESVVTGQDGRFTFNSRYVGMENVPVWIPGTAVRQALLGRTSPEFWARPNIVIGPRFVQTPVCATTGPSARVEIDLIKAYTPVTNWSPGSNISFFRRYNFLDGKEDSARGPQVYNVVSWKEWPRVTFAGDLSADDSARALAPLDSLNRALCVQAVRLTTRKEVDDNGGIVFYPKANSQGGGWNGDRAGGDISSGHAGVATAITNGNFLPVSIHEILHAFGLGHNPEHPSIMFPAAVVGIKLEKADVARLIFMRWVREGERVNNSRFSLAQMHQGQRRESGLPEEAVVFADERGVYGSVSNPTGPMASLK